MLLFKGMYSTWTNRTTAAKGTTFFLENKGVLLGFGVMTPTASKRASCQKNRRADSRSVMNCKILNVGYFKHFTPRQGFLLKFLPDIREKAIQTEPKIRKHEQLYVCSFRGLFEPPKALPYRYS